VTASEGTRSAPRLLMAPGKLIGEVLKPLPLPHAIPKIANDAQSKRIAANTGEEFTK